MSDASALICRTPLYTDHLALGARMTPFAGWEMPLSYAGQLVEHEAVRSHVGIFDVSHMGQVSFAGPRALAFLQRLVPADISRLQIGQSLYTQLTNENGGVLDDLIISRTGKETYFAVINASRRESDVAWILSIRTFLDMEDVAFRDESDEWVMIAVQGPDAFPVLEAVIPGKSWSQTPAFTLHPITFLGVPGWLSRTGYTGEIGAELVVPASHGEELWNRLLSAGVVPCGLAARDSLRLEAGYCLYGNDLWEEITPVEAGLSWSVGWEKKEDYPGKSVLLSQKKAKDGRRLIALAAKGRKPLRRHDPVLADGKPIGEVTSGGYSPARQCGIALAVVDLARAIRSQLFVASKTAQQAVVVEKTPFVFTSLKPKS